MACGIATDLSPQLPVHGTCLPTEARHQTLPHWRRNMRSPSRNQVFLDGNKRTSLVVCRTFLLLNGHNLVASNDEKYHAIMKLAEGQFDVDQMADWIRTHMVTT